MPNSDKKPEDVTEELEAFAIDPVIDEDTAESSDEEIVVDMDQEHDEPTGEAKDTDDSDDQPETDEEESGKDREIKESSGSKRFAMWYKTHRKISIPLTILLVVASLLAIPLTRYAILGPFVKKDIQVTITDSETKIPVSGVDVVLKGKTAKTDAQGKATLQNVSVGKGTLMATKKYFKDYQQPVTVNVANMKPISFSMQATGRQIPVKVTNNVTNTAVSGALVKVSDAEGITDENGAVTLVLPADQATQKGAVSAKGFNELPITIELAKSNVADNTFGLTPSGKIYFLSKRTGKIDVVKTNLDGSDRQVVLAGTGQEEDGNTVLLASRDWKYLALQARRENGQTRLYLITTADDSVLEMDSGNSTFSPVGWSDHSFVYVVARNNIPIWQSKNSALKTYNADTKQATTIDETTAEGISESDYANEVLGNPYIMKDTVVYIKQWYSGYLSAYRLAGKRSGLLQAKANGSNKLTVKDFDAASTSSLVSILSEPEELYVAVYAKGGKATYYEYTNNTLAAADDVNADSFNQTYPTYLVSPGGSTVFWGEPRDGKSTLFTANLQLEKPKQLASGSEFSAYGWFTDNYILMSKGGSELYIVASGGFNSDNAPLKIADYHKPARTFEGYGYGYGGQ